MKAFQEGYASANSIQIHYHRSIPANGGVFPIVFLHGVTDNGLCWQRVAQALPDDYDLLLVDARGHGKSSAPDNGYGVEDRAADTVALIAALGLHRPVLVGHSMGAETAIATAAVFPDHVRAVVLEDPPWPGRFWGSTPAERTERAAQWRSEIQVQKNLSIKALIEQARHNNPAWSEQEVSPWADAKLEMSPNLVGLVTSPRRRWSDYVRQSQCPILLVTADPQLGAIVSANTAQEAATMWKQGRIVHIPGAGHSIHREQFEPYMRILQDFLKEFQTS